VVALSGLVVTVIATGPRVRGFKPGRGRWIFKGDKIRSTTYFLGGVKTSAPCRKIFGISMNLAEYERQNSLPFLAKFLLLRYHTFLLVTARELWLMNQIGLNSRRELRIYQRMVAVHGTPLRHHPVTVKNQSSPSARHAGAWGRRGMSPTHS
jgi:hypothetical protein